MSATPARTAGSVPPGPYNVLLVVLDDLGPDLLRQYDGENHYLQPFPYPKTPTFDALSKGGLRFRQCRVSARCSPTRAQMMTGRYGFRTGIGDVVRQAPDPNWGLQLSERTLPKILRPAGYDCGAIGKWHLGNVTVSGEPHDPDSWQVTPTAAGFPHYAGCLYNLNNQPGAPEPRPDYYKWHRVENGAGGTETRYATTRQAEDAMRWLKQAQEPWFLYLPWSAIHGPFSWPPEPLHTFGPQPPDTAAVPGDPLAVNTRARAMVEALDTEMGRVLDSIPRQVRARTMVVVVGDNGTDNAIVRVSPYDVSGPDDPTPPDLAPYDPQRFKNTVYEGGIRVPLFVHGPLVGQPGRTVDHLVNGVDLFPTVLSFAGIPPAKLAGAPKIDGVDLLPAIRDAGAGPARTFSLSEIFRPNGPFPAVPVVDRRRVVQQAYIDGQGYKWIERRGGDFAKPGAVRTEVYDVFEDPLELVPLLPEDFEHLRDALNALIAS